MKCPKCGSENVLVEKCLDGFSTCQDCGYRWQHGRTQPEPTTAEMLLWLVENCEEIKTRSRGGSFMVTIYFRISYEKRMLQDFLGSVSEFNNLIKQAYEWAKEQEENLYQNRNRRQGKGEGMMTDEQKAVEEIIRKVLTERTDIQYIPMLAEPIATALVAAHYRPEAEVKAEVAKEIIKKILAFSYYIKFEDTTGKDREELVVYESKIKQIAASFGVEEKE